MSAQKKPRLRYKTRRKMPALRMPFVGNEHGDQFSHWDVPLSGGYQGGNMAGGAMATALLMSFREHSDEMSACRLGLIAARWAELARTASPDELESLRGQIVGFSFQLSRWLVAAVSDGGFGAALDAIDRQALIKRANAGLAFDEKAWLASLRDKE